MQIPTPIVAAAQQAVNRVLTLDPDSAARLQPLDGKVIELFFEGFNVSVYLIFVDDNVEVSNHFDGEADTRLSGTPAAMASLYRDNKALFSGQVQMSGDVAAGRQFKTLLGELDVDWEEQLSGITGDAVAHQFFRVSRDIGGYFSKAITHFGLDAGDYLKEEASVVAPNSEIEWFCSEVDLLVDGSDRLHARIELLEAAANNKDQNS